MKRKAPAGEPRPKGRPQKNPTEPRSDGCEELSREISNKPLQEIPNKTIIRADKNIEEQEVVMLLIKTNSKIHEPKSYNKAIDDPIHGRRWEEAIEEKLQNLESHQT